MQPLRTVASAICCVGPSQVRVAPSGLDLLTSLQQALAQALEGRVRPRGPDRLSGCAAVPSARAQRRAG